MLFIKQLLSEYKKPQQHTRLGGTYLFKDPKGEVIEVKGLVDLCKQYRLNLFIMRDVYFGNVSVHKGWTKHEPISTRSLTL